MGGADSTFRCSEGLPLSELNEVSLDSYGVNRRLVLRKMDLSYDSFDFTLERESGAIARKKLLRTWSRPGLPNDLSQRVVTIWFGSPRIRQTS